MSPLSTHRLTYAQAHVYNPVAFDLFTQAWQVTLEPATMLDDGAILGSLGSPAMSEAVGRSGVGTGTFREATGLFDAIRDDLALLGSLNNH